MLKSFGSSLVLALLLSKAHATQSFRPNVIFITIDGVRSQEAFFGVQKPRRADLQRGTELLPELKKAVSAREALSFSTVWIGNEAAISLPGYRSIFSGEFESICKNNKCPQTNHLTIYDDLIQQGFRRRELASISTWPKIAQATEAFPGQIFQNAGNETYRDPTATPKEARYLRTLNEDIRRRSPPWKGSKWDDQTFSAALYHLKKFKPRLMNISFGDADEFAHRQKYGQYIGAISALDLRLVKLRETLDSLGEYGRSTSIVITTDHGRGQGIFWSQHIHFLKTSDHAWAFVIPSKSLLETHDVIPARGRRLTHLDIRPTLETLLGVPVKVSLKNTGKSLVHLSLKNKRGAFDSHDYTQHEIEEERALYEELSSIEDFDGPQYPMTFDDRN
jgi:hypothetical protein